MKNEADEDLDSWLRCLHIEYALGDISLEQLEKDAEFYISIYDQALSDKKEQDHRT